MAKDLTVYLEDRPGTLATLGETLGNAGINIDGMCGFASEGRGIFHVLVDDGAAARIRKIADAGVNVDLSYLATSTRIVIGADDLEKARAAL
jgi:hypothetical protein